MEDPVIWEDQPGSFWIDDFKIERMSPNNL
jgi:hypothetical protein